MKTDSSIVSGVCRKSLLFAAFATGVAWCGAACAQDMRKRYADKIDESSSIKAMGVDSFGDRINLKNGSVEFVQTDIDIPGNNALPVRLSRSFLVVGRDYGNDGSLSGFGSLGGDIDLPHLSAVFSAATGWQVAGANPYQRCSQALGPPVLPGWQTWKYWSGYWLHIPGEGDQALLANPPANIPAPNGLTIAPWATKNFWRVACTPTTKNNYPGEGFVLLAPDGRKYYLDWVVSKSRGTLIEYVGPGQSGTSYQRLPRIKVYFLVSRIEDAFGNWVSYSYDDLGLTGITSSDGRQIVVTSRTTDGQIQIVNSSVGSWSYGYLPAGFTVRRPDGTTWQYASTGSLQVIPAPNQPTAYSTTCPMDDGSDGQFTYSVTAPWGAQAVFNFMVQRHFRHNIPRTCSYSAPITPNSNYYYRPFSNYSDTLTLQSKTITGPGLPEMVWSYKFGIGGSSSAFQDKCVLGDGTGPLCNKYMKTEVRGPNRFERYTFGAWYGVNEGQLAKVETGSDENNIVKTENMTYLQDAEISAQAFPDSVGSDLMTYGDHLQNMKLRPQTQKTIEQDKVRFSSAIPSNGGVYSFDAFARPTTVIKSSTPLP